MVRVFPLALVLLLAACGGETPPVQSAAAATSQPLFRGTGGEVRLRCGSETLRARLRQGQIIAQTGSGESAVLKPIEDSRAESGPAYSDGKLTLYKIPETSSWALASGTAPAAPCMATPPTP